jgi:hypothetical protein
MFIFRVLFIIDSHESYDRERGLIVRTDDRCTADKRSPSQGRSSPEMRWGIVSRNEGVGGRERRTVLSKTWYRDNNLVPFDQYDRF